MYEAQFGLHTKPFAVTPDPKFLFSSRGHREALAALLYGVKQRRGFICMVGEVGTGKTTLLRALLEQLDVWVRTILITHTTVDSEGLLRMILHDLEVPHEGRSRVELIQTLNEVVLQEHQSGLPPPVLIIDEAQNLADDVLEEVRLLTNLEIGDTKLLQVILSGQPELQRKLRRQNLRQLGQRIAVRAFLQPLDQDETTAYIKHRLRVAGAKDVNLFKRPALRAVWWRTAGVPRLVNILCEQALVNAFGAGQESVTAALVEEAARDLDLERPRTAAAAPPRPSPVPRRGWRSLWPLGGRA